jgi:hypothetical protein
MENQEPGIITILKALRELVDAVPAEGQQVDWPDLERKKEIGKRAMAKLEEILNTEPVKSESIRCDFTWPQYWS